MSNQIILKKSSVAAKVPLSTDLAFGELALNYADGILYYKNSAGTIASISGSGGGGGGGGAVALANETYSTSATVSATGVTQGTSTVLSSDYNIITSASATDVGVILPTPSLGRKIAVVNRSSYGIQVYPAVGNIIDNMGVNTPISMPKYGGVEFIGASTSQWYMTYNDNNSSANATSDYTLYSRTDTLYSYLGQTTLNTSYTPGNVQLFLNGVLLKGNGVDYTEEPTGTTITFTAALAAAQEIDVISYNTGVQKNTIGVSMALTQFYDIF